MLRLHKSLVLGASLALTTSAIAVPALAGIYGKAGVMCQRDYQNNWQVQLNYAWNNCSGFKNAIGNAQYYYNLHGAEQYWEDGNDYWVLDAVDLFYSETHGGAWSGRAVWAMWDQGSLADSRQMRLGNENQRLSIFSTYACETLKHDDIVGRYGNIMRGGLRYTTGSHDKFYDGWTTEEVGRDYARNLNDGDTIRYAWRDGVSDWWTSQDATAMTTGRNASECSSRRAYMRYSNYQYYSRIADYNVGYYCWTWWDNL